MRFGRKPAPSPDTLNDAVTGWECTLEGRSDVERALTVAVLVACQMREAPMVKPGPGNLERAVDRVRRTQPGLINAEARRGVIPPPKLLYSPVELLESLHEYLLLAMGSHDPQNMNLCEVATAAAGHASVGRPRGPMFAIQSLIEAEHCAEGVAFTQALDAVDRVIKELKRLRADHPDVARDAWAATLAAQAELKNARDRLRATARWRELRERVSEAHTDRAADLLKTGAFPQALAEVDQGLAVTAELTAQYPGAARWQQGLANQLLLRATARCGCGDRAAALADARRSRDIYQRRVGLGPESYQDDLPNARDLVTALLR